MPLPLPPYPPLFHILPSQQTPISSDPWMFGPYFLLFRSFQSPNFGCLVPTFCFLDRSNLNFWGFSFSLYNVLSRYIARAHKNIVVCVRCCRENFKVKHDQTKLHHWSVCPKGNTRHIILRKFVQTKVFPAIVSQTPNLDPVSPIHLLGKVVFLG